MASCKWCGVERDAPAVGPHVCDPQRVRARVVAYMRKRSDDFCSDDFGLDSVADEVERGEDMRS